MWKQQQNKLQYAGNMVEISLPFSNTQNFRELGFLYLLTISDL